MDINYKNLPDQTVLSLIAPTASGKTDLACRLFDTGRFELISVDSALIYQDMNIGTAKPTHDELTRYPHHLVDIIDPTKTYNVASFVTDVQCLIDGIHERNKIPLLVGGTMMYYMALFDGLSAVPDTDPIIRKQVADWLSTDGIAELYRYLQAHDPVICERLRVSDTQRVTRAIEVYIQTGTPMSIWQNTQKIALCNNPTQHWLALSVEPDRAWLHKRIAQRLDMMWQTGLVDEVINLVDKYPDLTPDMPSMRCVGYRQVLEYLALIRHDVMIISPVWQAFTQQIHDNTMVFAHLPKQTHKNDENFYNLACQDMKNKALYATRQLAKRQATWQRQLARLCHPSTPTVQEIKPPTSAIMMSFSSIEQVQTQLLF